ncbi:MAG: ABC transporter permease [Clostridia bacterium]|nr:ABC transporter permease [Clostridia bacterium]
MEKEIKKLIRHTVIEPKKLLHLNFGELWKYRDLITLFVKKDFSLIYKQTILGPLWVFLNPLITTVIYTVVFGGIANISTNGVPKILFYMAGNTLWTFFSDSISKTANTFKDNAQVFGKIYFPRLTRPIALVIYTGINYVFQLLMFVPVWIYYIARGATQPNWACMWALPVVLLFMAAMALGCGLIVSSITIKYRDMAIVITFAVKLWMYATPVVYPMTEVKNDLLRRLIACNPVTQPMELYRFILLGEGRLSPGGILWSAAFAVLVLLLGMMYFNKVEKTFMDTI